MLTKLNPFLANVPFFYLLKTPENLWFSGVFRGYKIGTLARNGLKRSNGLIRLEIPDATTMKLYHHYT